MLPFHRVSICLALLAAACNGKLGHRVEGVVALTLPVPPETHRLSVEVDFGSITVLAAAGDTLTFEGDSLRAADDETILRALADVDLTLLPSQEGDLLRLRAPALPPGIDAETARMVVRGVLRCPPRLQVTVRTGRGSLKGSGITGGLDLATSLGDVAVSDCRGPAELRTDQGDIMVDDHRGNLALVAKTGSARAFVTELGEKGVEGKARDALEVHLPRRTGFDLSARTDGGKCHNSFGIKIVIDATGASMDGQANGGGPRLVLHSDQGSVTVGASD